MAFIRNSHLFHKLSHQLLKRRSFAAVEAEAVVAGPVAVVVGSLTVGLHGLIDHLEVGVELALLLVL